MSIVLVIISLLTAAVLVGRELIHQAQLRSLISDKERYVGAVQTFKIKYNALPGDMRNATSYWGVNDANCGGDSNFSICTGTSNGNGDGQITGAEMYTVWNQLALAGLIPGKYAGGQVNGSYGLCTQSAIDANLPKTALSQVYPMIWYEGAVQQYMGDTNDFNGFYLSTQSAGHVMVFGTPLTIDRGGSGPVNNWPSMYSADTQSIDSKLDDGNPATGRVQALAWGSAAADYCIPGTSSCVNCSQANLMDFSAYTYNLSNTKQAGCAMAFINVFQ